MSKIIVGLSGGVDSSVSALLLQQQGYDVEGLFMKNWEEDDTDEYCSAAVDADDAGKICQKLNIPFQKINFAAEYWDRVFEYFLAEYKSGRTPNPDILCNKEIKFKAFLDYALSQGAERIATGHYVRVRFYENSYQLLKGLDPNKDQSYFLYTLSQTQLSKSLFPVGELLKPEVRKIAEEFSLQTYNKKDSTGICFIGERKFKDFLKRYLPAQPGKIQTPEGKVIGQHEGLMYYTIGQRQGLGIGGQKGAAELPWYVVEKDIEKNILVVAQDHQHPKLYANQLICSQLHWVKGNAPGETFQASAKIRYRTPDQACQAKQIANDRFFVQFDKPQWAITPGQSIVLYQGEICLGGGVIEEAIR
jgi:tRNA-specific 2-thiouridylase